MDQDRAAECIVIDAAKREVVHHHGDLIWARDQPGARDRDRAVPDQDQEDRKACAEDKGAQALQPLPFASARGGGRYRQTFLVAIRQGGSLVAHVDCAYMNCSVMACAMSGACRTCFFSTINPL